MTEKKAKKIKKISLVIALICFCSIVLPLAKYYIIGPRYLGDSPVLNEQVIYYKFNKYYYDGYATSDIKSGKCIANRFFETFYLSQADGDDYIINSQLHERFLYKREDLIDNIFKLGFEDLPISYNYDENGGFIDVDGDKYSFLVTNDRGLNEYNYSTYISVGSVNFNSKQLGVYTLKDDYNCDFLCVCDSDAWMDYIFTKIEVDENAFYAKDPQSITSCVIRGQANFKAYENAVFTDESLVIDALKKLKSDDTVKTYFSDSWITDAEHLYIDLVYGNLPVCKTDKICITFKNDEVYYMPDDMSSEIYLITDRDVADAFR